jgi:hypothetical protein
MRDTGTMGLGRMAGVLTGLLVLLGTATAARAQEGNGVVSVCVNQSNGALRMLLTPSVPTPANCSAGEQFMQWNMHGAEGAKGPQGEKGPKGDKGDKGPKGDAGKDGQDGKDGKDGEEGKQGIAGPAGPAGKEGPPGPPGSPAGGGHGGGLSGSTFQAPLRVTDKAGHVVFEVEADEKSGGYASFKNASGQVIIQLGVSPGASNGALMVMNNGTGQAVAELGVSSATGNGGLMFMSPDGVAHLWLALDVNRQGHLEFSQSGLKTAELAPGNKGTMGLRIFNESHQEVITLEEMPSGVGAGGGGLMIHNSWGGDSATITPLENGVGVFHGVTAVMPVNHP